MTDRDKLRKYRNDVFYDAWRRGIDPDRAVDCATDCYYDGRSPESCVDHTVAKIRQERERRERLAIEEQEQQEAWERERRSEMEQQEGDEP